MTGFGTADGVADGSGVSNGQATKRLAITVQPVGAASGAPLSVQPVVRSTLDGALNSSFTGNVTATLSGVGALSGTVTRAAVGGIATFTDLVITGAGVSNLIFAATGHVSATSVAVTTA